MQRHLVRYGPLLLLWLFLAQTALAARATSITLDEPLHIASGYASLVTGDFRLVEEHPPLLKMLQAAPLLWADPALPDPRTVPGWEEGDLVEFARHTIVPYRPIDPLVFAARVPTMLVGVLLGALIFRWTQDLAGRRSYLPLLALVLFSFDPNMLAHAGVAATDLGVAAGTFAAMYCFWRWLRRPTGADVLVAALTLGLALATKNTALMLGPVFAGLILWGRPAGRALKPYLLQGALIAAGAFLALWAIYGFEFGAAPGLPFPIPAPSHLLPLLKLQEHMRDGHSAFLMGQNYHHGDWRYFPIAFALKTPPLTLALTALCFLPLAYLKKRTADVPSAGSPPSVSPPTESAPAGELSSPWRHESRAALWAFPLLYFIVSLTSGINIGYRHLLPILPFVYVGAASSLSRIRIRTWRLGHGVPRIAGYGLLLGYVAVTLSLFPWYLAYFNVFAGGPVGGYRYLVDSNLDWGQTWKALSRYLEAEGITEFYLSNYNINDPRAYGLDYTPLPPWPDAPPVMPQRFNPPPGVYAISTTHLQGVVIADPEMFDYFRNLEPTARIGYAMYVYNVPPKPPVNWVAQCSTPVAPLPVETLREGLGVGDGIPLLVFDCEQSWLIPPGDGRYVLSREYAGAPWALLDQARLAYAQKQAGYVPPFDVYEWNAGTMLAPATPATSVSTAGDVLTFLGYSAPLLRAGETAVVETAWRIEALPAQPLSLMAHLLQPDGIPIAVGDGLGAGVDQWLPGSLLIQRHRLAIPAETPPGTYSLHVGAYTYPELERLPVLSSARPPSDHIIAGDLEVRAP
jgi:hypothetical protein